MSAAAAADFRRSPNPCCTHAQRDALLSLSRVGSLVDTKHEPLNTEELSDDQQEDVLDPAAVGRVYGLGGSDTSDTPVEEGAGGAGCAGGGA